MRPIRTPSHAFSHWHRCTSGHRTNRCSYYFTAHGSRSRPTGFLSSPQRRRAHRVVVEHIVLARPSAGCPGMQRQALGAHRETRRNPHTASHPSAPAAQSNERTAGPGHAPGMRWTRGAQVEGSRERPRNLRAGFCSDTIGRQVGRGVRCMRAVGTPAEEARAQSSRANDGKATPNAHTAPAHGPRQWPCTFLVRRGSSRSQAMRGSAAMRSSLLSRGAFVEGRAARVCTLRKGEETGALSNLSPGGSAVRVAPERVTEGRKREDATWRLPVVHAPRVGLAVLLSRRECRRAVRESARPWGI